MPTSQEKLRALLEQMVQMDQADLDFGIYRILNIKREEFLRFLDETLFPQVQQTLQANELGDAHKMREELESAITSARSLRMDPEIVPVVRDLRARIADAERNQGRVDTLFSYLYDFFRRYYQKGDFLALPRYKRGVYAIPYEGEEVKLHWANADQYYIKSSENFRDYTFHLPDLDNRRVHFRMTEADTETDNNKAAQDRVFVLRETDAVTLEDGELTAWFFYRQDAGKRRQDALNALAAETIRNSSVAADWRDALATPAPTPKNANRTLLDVKLLDYTARNTFDYFIHKDLGGFLRRELDFYIKNELMHLDDLEAETAPRVEQYLNQIRVLRGIAHKIIRFLAQLEDFQKKLWLKKKFVVDAQYGVTLNRVPESLYPAILANDKQREAWVKLFAIQDIAADAAGRTAYSEPLTVEFLEDNPYLVLDTQFFDAAFKDALLASPAFADLDANLDGLLLNSDNFQALNLLQARYREQIKCIYIDPPYNKDGDGFVYKDGYRHSSWLSLMSTRLLYALDVMENGSLLAVSIDDNELNNLEKLADQLGFVKIGLVAVQNNPKGRVLDKNLATSHEYLLILTKAFEAVLSGIEKEEEQILRDYPKMDEGGRFRYLELRNTHREFNKQTRQNLWFPIYVDLNTYDDTTKNFQVTLDTASQSEAVFPVWDDGFEGCWTWGAELARSDSHLLVARRTEGKLKIYRKSYSTNVDGSIVTRKPKTLWLEKEFQTEKGQTSLDEMFGELKFKSPKAVKMIETVVALSASDTPYVLDFFAGSGTTGHAVINLNRQSNASTKYILCEVGNHFDNVLKPRIMKAIYSADWKDGKPIGRQGVSHAFKYLRLESYEDCLNNLRVQRIPAQQAALDSSPEFREDYLLGYMLDFETRDSLLSLADFERPFDYALRIANGSAGETTPRRADLVETFNYLLGLRVRQNLAYPNARAVTGTLPDGKRALILWRDACAMDDDALRDFFQGQGWGSADPAFDVIYVNGPNTLRSLRPANAMWTVLSIEEAFLRRMFEDAEAGRP